MPSGALSHSRSASPCVPADALRLLNPSAGRILRQLREGGCGGEQSGARATSTFRRPLLLAACVGIRYFEPTCAHLPPASARQRGWTPRWGSRCSTSSRPLLTCVAASRTLGPSPFLAAILAPMASLHATWRPLLLLLSPPCPIADEPRLLTLLAGLVHGQPPVSGHRSEPSSARATCALRRLALPGSACAHRSTGPHTLAASVWPGVPRRSEVSRLVRLRCT